LDTSNGEPQSEDQRTTGYCIYINSLAEGAVPLVRNEKGYPYVFATQEEAEREIAEATIGRLQEFLGGLRDFEDAMTVEEYVVAVDVWPDGSVSDEFGGYFGCEGNYEGKRVLFRLG